MTPTVAPRFEMGGTAAAAYRKRDRNFADAKSVHRRFHHHLAREFHAGGLEVEPVDRLLVEAAQAAMEIAARALEKQPADAGEHGVAQIAVKQRHGAWRDAALETISHYQLVSAAQHR